MTHFRTIVVISMVFITLAAAFLLFRNRLYARLQASEEQNLADRAQAVSEIFYIKLDDQLTMLESQARYFRGIDLSDYNAMKETIMSTRGIGDFKNIGVANASGATINYNGTSSGNILLTDYFRDALRGNHAISETIVTDEEGYEVLVLAVPIRKEETTVGVIYGTFTKKTLDSILESISFSDSSTNILFNQEGEVLAKTTSNSLHGDAIRITDIIPDATAPDDGTARSYYFMENGQRYVAMMVPIGIHDWYFTSIMPESVITDQTTQITVYVGIVVGVVIIQFLIVLLHISSLIRSSDRIENMNEQFRIINDQSHNIVFAYNYKEDSMTIEGNISHIISERKSVYHHADAESFLSLVHPEDAHICQAIQAVRSSAQLVIQGELRLKNLDENYYWYRLNATIFRDELGNPTQLIGSIFDVDEQRNKEIKLMEQAQMDSLTNILNKGSFRNQIQTALAQPEKTTALYIIDLDNFKAVNDNLGHAMGDKVLVDVANKLVELFGSRECTGRIGGDEFAAFLTGDDLTQERMIDQAAQICKRMQEIYTSYTAEVHVSVSTGVAVYPKDGTEYFESAWGFIDSPQIQVLGNDLEQYNMHVLAYFDNGFRCVTTSEQIGPIEKVEDMEGLNIRTPENQIVMETMSALHAQPKSYPFAGLKAALSEGTFDAQENPIPVIYNNKLYEVQKYLSVTNHSYDAMPLAIRRELWEKLKPEYQQIIEQSARNAQQQNRQLVKQQTATYVKDLEEVGMEIYYPDLQPFRTATSGVMEMFRTVYGEELIRFVTEYENSTLKG